MSVDDIRNQKGLALLEYQEAETRLQHARGRLQNLSQTLTRLAQLLDPNERTRDGTKRTRIPNLDTLQSLGAKTALNFESAVQAVTELADALKAVEQAEAKKRGLGL